MKSKNEKIRKYLRWTRIKRALTARTISLIITAFVAWILTGNPWLGLSIGLFDAIFKIGVYYCHETLWERKMTNDIKKIKQKYID